MRRSCLFEASSIQHWFVVTLSLWFLAGWVAGCRNLQRVSASRCSWPQDAVLLGVSIEEAISRLSLHVPTNDFVIGNDGSGDLAPWAIKGATPRGDDVILWFDWLRVPYERRRQGNWQVSDFLKFKVLAVTRRTTDGLHATGSPHAMLLDMDDPVLDDERKRIPIPKVVRAARDCKWAAPAGVVSVREDCVRLVAPENGCVVTTDIPSQFLGRRLAVTYDIKESQGFATLDIGTTNNIISRKFGPLYGKATNITVTLPTMVPSDADTLVLIRMAFGWLEIRSLGFE